MKLRKPEVPDYSRESELLEAEDLGRRMARSGLAEQADFEFFARHTWPGDNECQSRFAIGAVQELRLMKRRR